MGAGCWTPQKAKKSFKQTNKKKITQQWPLKDLFSVLYATKICIIAAYYLVITKGLPENKMHRHKIIQLLNSKLNISISMAGISFVLKQYIILKKR